VEEGRLPDHAVVEEALVPGGGHLRPEVLVAEAEVHVREPDALARDLGLRLERDALVGSDAQLEAVALDALDPGAAEELERRALDLDGDEALAQEAEALDVPDVAGDAVDADAELGPGRGGRARAGTAEEGYLHCGPHGAGHFVKMIHNGIEYGLMQAYAEGFDLLRGALRALPLADREHVRRAAALRAPPALRRSRRAAAGGGEPLTAHGPLAQPARLVPRPLGRSGRVAPARLAPSPARMS
jgi:hypothetical protein